jgi:hypothetical protein
VTVQLPQSIVFQGGNPVQIKGQIVAVESGTSDVALGGVSVEGFARQVEVNGETVAQVVWNEVEKSVDGVAKGAVLDNSWSSQFPVSGGTVEAGRQLTAGGPMAAMSKAVRGISAQTTIAQSGGGAAGSSLGKSEDEAQAASSESNSAESGRNAAAQGNDIASNFEKLKVRPKTETAVAEVLEGTRITTQGCSIRTDEAQGVAVVQSKIINVKGGIDTGESACTDSEVRYELKRSVSRCSDKVEVGQLKAWPQYILYYTDDGGSNTDVGQCRVDTDKEFKMVEDKTGCTLETDFTSMTAKERSELVYENSQNNRIVVRGCEVTPSGTVAMKETATGCTLRHDYSKNVSYQMKKITFALNNQEFTARECTDTDTSYPHETVAKLNGAPVCDYLVSTENGFAYPQNRKRINLDGAPQWVTECTPDTAGKSALVKTVAGCESRFVHNLSAGQSFGMERTYYTGASGTAVYVSECLQSEVTYTHKIEGGDIHGYEAHDDQLYGFAKTKLYIDGTQIGKVEVSPAQVREGAVQVPYVFQRSEKALTGEVTYEGCNSIAARNNVEVYARPDGSTFSKVTGAAAPADPVNSCTTARATSWAYVPGKDTVSIINCGYKGGTSVVISTVPWARSRSAVYSGYKTVTRTADNTVISHATAERSVGGCATSGTACISPAAGTPPACPTTYQGSLISGWYGELGW